ncbi:MAG: hypothetical protein R3300_20405 [Candidatus Promineifilaceae bacterium]|nr:hypothetical protein [Candidatus Promineifilaceae bacterium]
MNRTLRLVVAGLAGILIIILAAVFIIVLGDVMDDEPEQAAAVPVLPSPTSEDADVQQATESTATVVQLPSPQAIVLATSTPEPSATPLPAETALPTETPLPTATNTPRPVVVQPTSPPPTNTPVPTQPPPNTQGLTLLSFGLQARSEYRVNGPVWFEFSVANNSGGAVPFGALGVMPKKDGSDRPQWYQHSWGGNNDAIPPAGLQWEDNIRLPEPGAYSLRLVICFDSYQSCRNGGAWTGPWVTLSQEVAININ